MYIDRWKREPRCPFLVPNSTIHILPLEIRLEIYSQLSGFPSSVPTTSHLPFHPLYPLLFVCHLLRADITYIFYSPPKPAFEFLTPQSCQFFLTTTAAHVHLITSLTIHLPQQQTHLLEPIARKLFLANAPLRRLTIHLASFPVRFHHERIVTAYMLPRRVQVSAAAHREALRRERDPLMWNIPISYTSRDFMYAETHSGLAIRLAETSSAALGMLKNVRYLAVHGQPKDVNMPRSINNVKADCTTGAGF